VPNYADKEIPSRRPAGSLSELQAFAYFVKSQSHLLSVTPQETIPIARNYAADGPVATIGSELAEALNRPWIAQEPRPRAQKKPALLLSIRAHIDYLESIALGFDAKRAVSVGRGKLRLWDLTTGKELLVLTVEGADQAVALSRDGRRVVCGGGKYLQVWDLASAQLLQRLPVQTKGIGIRSLAISEESSFVLAVNENSFGYWSDSGDGTHNVGDYLCSLECWNLETGEVVWQKIGQNWDIDSVAIDGEGLIAATAGSEQIPRRRIAQLRIWAVRSGRLLSSHESDARHYNRVSLSADGRTAIVLVQKGLGGVSAEVWDLHLGKIARLPCEPAVSSVAMTLDGRVALFAGRALEVWDVASGTKLKAFTGQAGGMHSVAISADGKLAISASHDDDRLCVWDLGGESDIESTGYSAYLAEIAPDSLAGIIVNSENSVIKWSPLSLAATEHLGKHKDRVAGLIVSPDGKLAVTSSNDRTVQAWDLVNNSRLWAFDGHASISSLVATPDWRHVLSGDWDGKVRVFELTTGKEASVLLQGSGVINSMAMSPDGRWLAVGRGFAHAEGGVFDAKSEIWDVGSGEVLAEWPQGSPVNYVSFTPDGALLVTDREVAETWKSPRFEISPCGRRIVLLDEDESALEVRDLKTGEVVQRLCGHALGINDFQITRDGKFAISVGGDKTLRAWNIITGENVLTHAFDCRPRALSHISAKGHLILSRWDSDPNLLSVRNLLRDAPIVTAAYLYQLAGDYDSVPTAQCIFCGRRFVPNTKVLACIDSISGSCKVSLPESFCLKGAPEAWGEEGLISECPYCHAGLRFNPFLAIRSFDATGLIGRLSGIRKAAIESNGHWKGPWCEIDRSCYPELDFVCKRCGTSHSWFVTSSEKPPEECHRCGLRSG
jgi:WD40 repeat protein